MLTKMMLFAKPGGRYKWDSWINNYSLLLLPKNEFYSMYSFIFKHFCDLYYREHSLIKDVELNHSGEQMLEKLVRELFQVSKNFD